jgi:AcrR family transcriptional regulator
MARRPSRPARRERPTPKSAPPQASRPEGTERERIIAAFLTLLAETSIDRIGLTEIAASAGVTLAQMRGEFGSPLAILAAYLKDIDRAVLAEDFSDMEEEPPRERLFDVLMRRLEKLAPHRQAIRSLMRSARGNPPLTLALNRLAVRSQKWMLAAAGAGGSGPRGALRAQGLAVLFNSVLRTWVRDDDPGLARTMAALDRALARGQRFAGFLNDLFFIPSRLCRLRPRRRRRDNDEEEAVAA